MSSQSRVIQFAVDQGVAIVRTVPILHQGWELDDLLYICADGRVIGTDHGHPEFVGFGMIYGKQQEYKDLVDAYERIIEDMTNANLKYTI